MAPTDPRIIYVGSQHVWKSTNEGQSWTQISPDLTRHDPKTMGASGGPITKDNTGVETYATVFTIAPSREGRQRHLGRIRRRLRAGDAQRRHELEERHAEGAAATSRRISLIEASPFRAGTAYVAANRYQQDDFKPYVFRTDDYGENVDERSSNGVGADRLRARDPRGHQARRSCCISAPSTASTSRSTTARSGSRCGRTCPTRRCTTSRSEERDLVIATHGRGFYVMDNIAPLRQGGLQTTSNFHLYKPEDALRGLDRNVAVDYYLKQPAQKVTMEFLDAAGQGDPHVHRHARPTPSASRRRRATDDGPRRPPEPHPAGRRRACTG